MYVLPADRFNTVTGLGLLEVMSACSVAYERRVHLSYDEFAALLAVLGVRMKRGVMSAKRHPQSSL